MMKVALNIIKENPMTGVGLNNYSNVMNRYDRTRENISYKFPFPVHNAFLIIACESGLLAMVCFIFILFGAALSSLRFFLMEDRLLSLIGIGFFSSIVTWSSHAQIKMDFAGINISLWFTLGIIMAIREMLKKDRSIFSVQRKETG
jgi:O-antigen ligase